MEGRTRHRDVAERLGGVEGARLHLEKAGRQKGIFDADNLIRYRWHVVMK
jgi:hypothetical protein